MIRCPSCHGPTHRTTGGVLVCKDCLQKVENNKWTKFQGILSTWQFWIIGGLACGIGMDAGAGDYVVGGWPTIEADPLDAIPVLLLFAFLAGAFFYWQGFSIWRTRTREQHE